MTGFIRSSFLYFKRNDGIREDSERKRERALPRTNFFSVFPSFCHCEHAPFEVKLFINIICFKYFVFLISMPQSRGADQEVYRCIGIIFSAVCMSARFCAQFCAGRSYFVLQVAAEAPAMIQPVCRRQRKSAARVQKWIRKRRRSCRKIRKTVSSFW